MSRWQADRMSKFQSTLPRGERPARKGENALFSGFNPRSHAGSDALLQAFFRIGRVSIHAPTRGATISTILKISINTVSIHAPTRGATRRVDTSLNEFLFQSTLPRGERLTDDGAWQRIIGFQSTLPRGERLSQSRIFSRSDKFQSTLPRGERPVTQHSRPTLFRFQSTLPRGERQSRFCITIFHSIVSIHAPTRGATAEGSTISLLPREKRD